MRDVGADVQPDARLQCSACVQAPPSPTTVKKEVADQVSSWTSAGELGELMRELDTKPIDLTAEGGSSSGGPGRRGGLGVPKKCRKCGEPMKGHKCKKK